MNFWKLLDKPIVGLCPMDGITDYPMREIQALVAKPDVFFTEFISVEGFIRNHKAFERHLHFSERQRPVVVQLFGYTPEFFYETIVCVAKLGFDGIDINMGCPAKSVLQKGGGGALIGNYKLAGQIIDSSCRAVNDSKEDIPLSIKTRMGKKEIETEPWISFLSSFPVSEVCVHGRLLSQLNTGLVNWEEIQKAGVILRKQGIVCLGNGGIKSAKEAGEMSKKYDIDGVLIGQAACGNPWVFSEHIPAKKEILKTILKHTKFVDKFYDEKGFVTILKHLSWYPKNFDNCTKLKVELLKSKNLNDVEKTILQFEKEAQIN